MKLTSSDIRRLYGKKLFILDGWEKSPVSTESETSPEQVIEAESKPEPEVALEERVVEKDELVVEEAKVAEPEVAKVEPIEKISEPDLSCFTSGKPVIWKMKPGSRLALILQKSEFTNRDLTGLLKASIVKAGIDPAMVGFGIIEDQCTAINLEEMSVEVALICNKLGTNFSLPVEWSGKKVWCVSPLAELPASFEKQQELDVSMSAIALLL